MSSAATGSPEAARMIRALDATFERYANAGDAAALAERCYTENARVLPPNTPLVRGRAAIRSFWERFLAAGCSDLKLETAEIDGSGDFAYGIGAYEYRMDGAQHVGKYVVVYQRQPDGSYLMTADSFSSND
jgi:ketosteroid isomerase-like protein